MESHKTPAAVMAIMDEVTSGSSISSTPPKAQLAVGLIESLKKRLFETDPQSQKVPFKALFTTVLVHFGRVLFQIVVTISGFFPTLIVASHIGGFILERWLEIVCIENSYLRLKKTALTLIQIFILISYCYFLVSLIYAPVFFLFVNLFSAI